MISPRFISRANSNFPGILTVVFDSLSPLHPPLPPLFLAEVKLSNSSLIEAIKRQADIKGLGDEFSIMYVHMFSCISPSRPYTPRANNLFAVHYRDMITRGTENSTSPSFKVNTFCAKSEKFPFRRENRFRNFDVSVRYVYPLQGALVKE